MSELIFCYVPVPDRETGKALLTSALHLQLAACGNLWGPMTSFYEWEGRHMEETEFVMLLKTPLHKQEALEAHIQKEHPYECPCIARFPVDANEGFAAWVHQQV